jgi:hypothetical protein
MIKNSSSPTLNVYGGTSPIDENSNNEVKTGYIGPNSVSFPNINNLPDVKKTYFRPPQGNISEQRKALAKLKLQEVDKNMHPPGPDTDPLRLNGKITFNDDSGDRIVCRHMVTQCLNDIDPISGEMSLKNVSTAEALAQSIGSRSCHSVDAEYEARLDNASEVHLIDLNNDDCYDVMSNIIGKAEASKQGGSVSFPLIISPVGHVLLANVVAPANKHAEGYKVEFFNPTFSNELRASKIKPQTAKWQAGEKSNPIIGMYEFIGKHNIRACLPIGDAVTLLYVIENDHTKRPDGATSPRQEGKLTSCCSTLNSTVISQLMADGYHETLRDRESAILKHFGSLLDSTDENSSDDEDSTMTRACEFICGNASDKWSSITIMLVRSNVATFDAWKKVVLKAQKSIGAQPDKNDEFLAAIKQQLLTQDGYGDNVFHAISVSETRPHDEDWAVPKLLDFVHELGFPNQSIAEMIQAPDSDGNSSLRLMLLHRPDNLIKLADFINSKKFSPAEIDSLLKMAFVGSDQTASAMETALCVGHNTIPAYGDFINKLNLPKDQLISALSWKGSTPADTLFENPEEQERNMTAYSEMLNTFNLDLETKRQLLNREI